MAQAGRSDRRSVLGTLDAALFVFAALAAVWLAYLLFVASLQPNWQLLLLGVFWALVAYLVLPRLHRILTSVYLPGYFIGRARTSDGLLGDPVNLAMLGDGAQIHAAMTRAGWTRADDVTLASSMRIIRTTLSRTQLSRGTGEPVAPVRPGAGLRLPAGGRRQPRQAAPRAVLGLPPGLATARWPPRGLARGGHLRPRRRPLPDDPPGDAPDRARCRRRARLRRHDAGRGQPHRDRRPDRPLLQRLPLAERRWRRDRDRRRPARARRAGPHDRGDGDHDRTGTRRDGPPSPTVFGAGVAFLRGLYSLFGVLVIVQDPGAAGPFLSTDSKDVAAVASTFAGVVLTVFGAVDLTLGVATFRGRNWARVLLMLFSVVQILGAFVAQVSGGPRLTLGAGLPTLALGILVLLALTSHRARDYATRAKAPGEPVAGPQPSARARADGVPSTTALPHQRRATTSDETPASPGRRARRD